MIEDTQIASILNSSREIDERAQMLIDLANERGGKDNISIIIIEP